MLDNLGNEIYGLIYKATNIQNNKCYIGQTKNFKRRKYNHIHNAKKGSHNYFHNALATYGLHNFKWEVLGYCNSKKELDEAEIGCIEFFQSNNSIYGYNKTKGGEGTCLTGKNNPNYGISNYSRWLQKYGKEIADQKEKERKRKEKETKLKNNSIEKRIEKFKITISNKSKEEKEEWSNNLKKSIQKQDNTIKKKLSLIRSNANKGSKNYNAKQYLLISPKGELIFLNGEFGKYCKENNLSTYMLRRVDKGEIDNYNGWLCYKYN